MHYHRLLRLKLPKSLLVKNTLAYFAILHSMKKRFDRDAHPVELKFHTFLGILTIMHKKEMHRLEIIAL